MDILTIGRMQYDFINKTNGMIVPNRIYMQVSDWRDLVNGTIQQYEIVSDAALPVRVMGMTVTLISKDTRVPTHLAYDPFLEN